MEERFPKTGQGPWHKALQEDLERDEVGYTNPNLHRRVDPQDPPEGSHKYKPNDYEIGIYSVNSYRTTESHYHDEDTEDCEIP